MSREDLQGQQPVGLMDMLSEMKERCLAREHRIQRELSLSPGEYGCLRVFPVSEELDVGALAAKLSLSHSRTSRIIERLVKQAWVTRRPSPSDRRTVLLKLSPEGIDMKGRQAALVRRCEAAIYGEMTEHDRRTVHAAFALVMSAMERTDATE